MKKIGSTKKPQERTPDVPASRNWGGAREGAGRPRNPSPLSWLWQEVERRYGKEAADDLRSAYNAHAQDYQKSLIAQEREQRRIEIKTDKSADKKQQ